jgi:hypothetical protein
MNMHDLNLGPFFDKAAPTELENGTQEFDGSHMPPISDTMRAIGCGTLSFD